jgi:hypothetical protein
MADAKRDQNYVTTLLATSNADGSTPVLIQVDPTTHALLTVDDVDGSDLSGNIASRDNNRVTVWMGVSSADGVTPTAIYADPATGELLVRSDTDIFFLLLESGDNLLLETGSDLLLES